MLKNLGIVNYGRDYHHFVGQGHESVIAAFAAMAHNMHMIASWVAQQAHAARKAAAADPGYPKPSAVPTQTIAADEHPATTPTPEPASTTPAMDGATIAAGPIGPGRALVAPSRAAAADFSNQIQGLA